MAKIEYSLAHLAELKTKSQIEQNYPGLIAAFVKSPHGITLLKDLVTSLGEITSDTPLVSARDAQKFTLNNFQIIHIKNFFKIQFEVPAKKSTDKELKKKLLELAFCIFIPELVNMYINEKKKRL